MKKNGHTGKFIKIISYMMAALLAFLQPCSVLAAELDRQTEAGQQLESDQQGEQDQQTEPDQQAEQPAVDDTASVKYIAAFGELAEEDAYFPCMYKPMLEELMGVFPETILVWLDGEEMPEELAVAWECEEDFDATVQPYYLFYPKWDETQYAIAESVKDNIEIPVITVEVPQSGGAIKNPEEAKTSLYHIVQEKAVLASVYLCDEYEVKAAPSLDSETVHTVVSGQSVQITDVETDEYGGIWYQVLLYQNGAEYTGYVEKSYLATSDEDFAEWEETYLDLSAIPMVMALSEGCPDIDQFPASYQNALYALKEKHPDWTFVRMDTGLDWNTAIANELGDKSWIAGSRSGSWQNGSAPQRGWSYASEGILKYYMDPRNFLDDSHIFQFEQLIYNSSYHTTDAVQGILNGSFMAVAIPDDGRTYAQAFTAIGQELGISPFHLAARVLQEQGVRGSSALISGAYPGYEGYYNFFNVNASGQGDAETIRRGLAKAKMEGWNTRYASLYGGAKIIGNQYILWGQDTLYLEKFNVANGKYANYTHQYMQNIEAPYYEASSIYKAYQKAGVLERRFVFKIPVYENMPASACAQPEKTDTLTLDKTSVSSLEVDKSITLIPYVNGSKVDHVNDMTFTSSNTAVATVDAKGKVTAVSPGDVTISCARSGASSANCTITVVKANPAVSTPVLSPVTYQEGIKLSDVALPAGWVWVNGDTPISVGTPSYAAVYTPEDTTRYNAVTKNISFTVTKAIPKCQVPSGLEVKSGAALGSIALPSGFSWESDAETVLTNAGEYTFYVSYNPDEKNYYTVNHIPIIVQVKETVPDQPADGNGNSGGTGSGTAGTGNGNSGGSDGGNGSGTTGTDNGTGSDDGTGTGGGNSGGSDSGSGNNGGSDSGTGSGNSGGSGNGTGAGNENNSTSDGSTSSGSTSGGNMQPPASGGSTSTGSTQPPVSSGSTTNGNVQPPVSSGSTTNGNTQPPISGGSTSAGNITIGNAQQEKPGSDGQSGNGASDNASEENAQPEPPPGNEQPSAAADNSQPGSTPAEQPSASSGNAQPGTAAVTAPSGNTQSPTVGASTANADNAVTNGGSAAAANWNSMIDMEKNGSSEGESENGEQLEEPDYFRPAVTIQMEDTTILTAEKLQMAKEQNFDLLLDMGGAITWSIDVDSIDESAMAEVDMGVTLGTNHVPQELISTILNGNKYLEITLAHQGTFGFGPVLNIALGKEYSGKYANLFYYNPETETLEFICDAVIGPDGVANLHFDHASCYLIIVSDESMSGVSFDDETVNPVTRWIIVGVFICMLLVIAGYGIFFFLKKRQEEADDDEEKDEDNEADDEMEEDEDNKAADNNMDEEDEEEEYEKDEPYEENKKPERHFRTFDLRSGKAEKEHERKDREKNDRRVTEKNRTEPEVEEEYFDEDDWIEDEDWQEPETTARTAGNLSSDVSGENDDWLDDEGNAEDDWIEDDEWME